MPPGAMMAQPPEWLSIARRASCSRLKSKGARASSIRRVPPTNSRIALVICTHVVASMPPKMTYTSMSSPTMTTATE
ncbi:hypothetical protein D3C75_1025540 [compost metagenome]